MARSGLRFGGDGQQDLVALRGDVVDRTSTFSLAAHSLTSGCRRRVGARHPVIPEADRELAGGVRAAHERRRDQSGGCGRRRRHEPAARDADVVPWCSLLLMARCAGLLLLIRRCANLSPAFDRHCQFRPCHRGSRQASPSRSLRTAARWTFASGPHEAFDLALGPGQRLFHRLALQVAHGHLGHDALRVDLHGDLGRRRRRGDRQDLVVVRVRVVVERALRRPFLGPGLERRSGWRTTADRSRRSPPPSSRPPPAATGGPAGSWPPACSCRNSRCPRSTAGTAQTVPSDRRACRGSSTARRPAARRAWQPPRRSADS